jgi:hypothetical protein
VHKRIISTVKWVEFVSDRMSFIILRGHWCDFNVLYVHVPTKGHLKWDDHAHLLISKATTNANSLLTPGPHHIIIR